MEGSHTGDTPTAGDVEIMLAGLLRDSHTLTLDRLPAVVAKHAARVGIESVRVYLADLQQRVLRPVPDRPAAGGPPPETGDVELRIDTTPAGRSFQELRVLAAPLKEGRGRTRWWVPLLDGAERLGVMRAVTAGPGAADERTLRELASVVALILTGMKTRSDTYRRLVCSRPVNVAGELQWRLAPPSTVATGTLTVGAIMEPAYEVGGDAFDYAVNGDTLHLAVFDAMGHDVSAGLTAAFAVSALRANRYRNLDLAACGEAVERLLIEEYGEETRFVTAIMAELNLSGGTFRWINHGHLPPVVIRGGHRSAILECPPAHPMGMDLGLPVTVCEERLEPGDQVLLYTDGVVEAGGRHGPEFGLPGLVDFVVDQSATGLPVPEILRRLIKDVVARHRGRLGDDA
ncbi:PP2C family protein-serine/threonine phosphatase, partial [Sinosporangium siamense]